MVHQFDRFKREHENHRPLARILVIDDDESILDLIQDLFSPTYQVTTARNGIEGLELLQRDRFDLLILDLGLSGLSGVEVIQHIRTQGPARTIPILVLSAYHDLRQRLEGSGATSFMTKPFLLEQLERRVADLLRPRAEATQSSLLMNNIRILQRA